MLPDIVSTGRAMLVRFRSDDTINWKGFYATYALSNTGADPVTPTPNAINVTNSTDKSPLPKLNKYRKPFDKDIESIDQFYTNL